MRIETAYSVQAGEYSDRSPQHPSARSRETTESAKETRVNEGGQARQPGELSEEEKKEVQDWDFPL